MQGKRGRVIVTKMEKWLYQHNICDLLLSTNISVVEEAISVVEDIVDDIDDLSDDVRSCKDVIALSKLQYEESFPLMSKVLDKNATEYEIVNNFKFDQIPLLLEKSSIKHPVVITSVRRSDVSDQLRFGKQYVVISADKDEIKIDYEHEGSGDFQVPDAVPAHLFTLRTLLSSRKSLIEQDTCLR